MFLESEMCRNFIHYRLANGYIDVVLGDVKVVGMMFSVCCSNDDDLPPGAGDF